MIEQFNQTNNLYLDSSSILSNNILDQSLDFSQYLFQENELKEENLEINNINKTLNNNNNNIKEHEDIKTEKQNSLINSNNSIEKSVIYENLTIKNDFIDKLSTSSNIINEVSDLIKENKNKDISINKNSKKKYRKDAYYKHFKVIFGKYLKNKVNILKNKCFPNLDKNNFSSPNYKYTGNPQEKVNYNYLSCKVKTILTFGKIKHNRQYNNNELIKYIEINEKRAKNKSAYNELISFLNDNLENAFISFYNDENELNKINNDKICILYDKSFINETGFSLLEKNGFLKAIKRKICKNSF